MGINLGHELRRLNKNLNVWRGFLTSHRRESDLDGQIEVAVQAILIEEFMSAMDSIDEYSRGQGEPLRDHLINNLRKFRHVIVDNGIVKQVFDENVAGDFADVRRGQEAAWALSQYSPSLTPASRSFNWRFVYLGIPPRKWQRMDPNLYSDVVAARLSAWGDKAPYWIFIEFGTASGHEAGSPYPSFSGRNPIARTRSRAAQVSAGIIREYSNTVGEVLAADLTTRFVEHDLTPVIIEQAVKTAWTKVFTQYGKRIQREFKVSGGGFTGRWREAIE